MNWFYLNKHIVNGLNLNAFYLKKNISTMTLFIIHALLDINAFCKKTLVSLFKYTAPLL